MAKRKTKVVKTKKEEKSSILLFLSAVGVLGAFTILSWFAYQHYMEITNPEGIIYIKADKSPFKIQPEDPGGMKIDYREKEIFGLFSGKKEKISAKKVKVLEDEKPLSKDEIFEKVEQKARDKKEVEQKAKEFSIVSEIIEDDKVINPEPESNDGEEGEVLSLFAREEDELVIKQITKKEIQEKILIGSKFDRKIDEPSHKFKIASVIKPRLDLSVKKKQPNVVKKVKKSGITITSNVNAKKVPAPKSMRKSSSKSSSSSSKSGKYYVQISSHQSKTEANNAWKSFYAKHSSKAKGFSKQIFEVTVSGKQYYRLGFGMFNARGDATNKCVSLKSAGQDCLVNSK